MDNNITQKTAEGINQASNLALENNHQQLTPVHLAITLLEDPEGLAQQAVLKHGNEETLRYGSSFKASPKDIALQASEQLLDLFYARQEWSAPNKAAFVKS